MRRQPDGAVERRRRETKMQRESKREGKGERKREREREREREWRGEGATFSSDALKKRLTPLCFSRTACRRPRECPGCRFEGSGSGLCMTNDQCVCGVVGGISHLEAWLVEW